jgi:hypothetical protein
MEKEIFSRSKAVNCFTLATISTATETYGQEIDTLGYNSVLFALKLVMTTGEVSAISVYASDTSGTYTTAESVTTLLNPDQLPITTSGIAYFGSVAKKRYLKISVTSASFGGSENFTVDGMAILSDSFTSPNIQTSMFEAASTVNAPGSLADDTDFTPPLVDAD